MPKRAKSQKPSRPWSGPDRRAPRCGGATDTLRGLKGAFVRPLGLAWHGKQLHVVLIDRRQPPTSEQLPTVPQMCGELRARLVAHADDRAARVMRHLGLVHDELGRKGWSGVEALPRRVIGKALMQAELLSSQETSPTLALFVERLRALRVAAELREARAEDRDDLAGVDCVDVSEATHEEYERMERGWVSTVSPALAPFEPKA